MSGFVDSKVIQRGKGAEWTKQFAAVVVVSPLSEVIIRNRKIDLDLAEVVMPIDGRHVAFLEHVANLKTPVAESRDSVIENSDTMTLDG